MQKCHQSRRGVAFSFCGAFSLSALLRWCRSLKAAWRGSGCSPPQTYRRVAKGRKLKAATNDRQWCGWWQWRLHIGIRIGIGIQHIRVITIEVPDALHSPGRCAPITGAKVALCPGETYTGDGDLDFGRDASPGVRATVSPRSTDTSRSASGTMRLSCSSGGTWTFVSSPSSCGGGGGSTDTKLCEAPRGWTSSIWHPV